MRWAQRCSSARVRQPSPAQAAFVVALEQDGSNIVATGSGTLDLTDLTFVVTGPGLLSILQPSLSYFGIAPSTTASADLYKHVSAPTLFGTGDFAFATSATGDIVSLDGAGDLAVPAGYASGGLLSDSAIWADATFASLGITRLHQPRGRIVLSGHRSLFASNSS